MLFFVLESNQSKLLTSKEWDFDENKIKFRNVNWARRTQKNPINSTIRL